MLMPNRTREYHPDQFYCEAGAQAESSIYSSSPGIYVDSTMMTEDKDNINIELSGVNLLPGSYDITMYYSSSKDNTYTCYCENNWIDFWRLENIDLYAGENQSQTFEISSVLPMHGINVSVSFNGDGYLCLSSIQIRRTIKLAVHLFYYGLLIAFLTNIFTILWINIENNGRIILLILTAMTLFSSIPIFGMNLGYGDDLEFHLLRIDALANGFRNRQFPVRISTYWNNGYGYAASLYYNDLFLTFPALLRLIGISVQNAYKQYLLFCNLATACISWFSFKNIFSKRYALIGTMIYVFLPYRLSCLYKRAALGEYTAMIFFPLIFWGVYRIYTAEPIPKDVKGLQRVTYNIKLIIPAVLGYSGVVSSHVISTLLVGIATILLCLIMIKKTLQPVILCRLLAVVGMIALVNAWYLVPLANSMQVNINTVNEAGTGQIQKHGTYIFQLFDIFPNGDGQSYTAMSEIHPEGYHDMSYFSGVGTLFVLIWFACIAMHKLRQSRNRTIGNICGLLSIIYLLMSTVWFPWDYIMHISPAIGRILGNIQFPWRCLGISGVLATINVMCFAEETSKLSVGDEKLIQYIFYSTLICLTIIPAMYFLHNYEMTSVWEDYSRSDSVPSTRILAGDYLPVNTDTQIFANPEPTLTGSVKLTAFKRQGDEIILIVSNTKGKDSSIDVPFLYCPGYVAIYEETGQMVDTIKGPDNRVRVFVSQGYNGSIIVKYRERKLWRLAEIITAISASGVIGIICTTAWKRKFITNLES